MPVAGRHPVYPNSTIVEAICGFQVQADSSGQTQAQRISKILEAFGEKFPNFEAVSAQLVDPGGRPTVVLGAVPLAPANAWRLSTEARDRSILIIGNDFIYSITAEHPGKLVYPGGEAFIAEILSAWETYAQITAPTALTRIGMRYVNAIPRTIETVDWRFWLKPTGLIPAHVINTSKDPAVLRVETWQSETGLLILNLGVGQGLPASVQPIILDIDRHEIGPHAISSLTIDRIIRDIHESIWVEFRSAMTDDFELYLEGKT